MAPYCTENEKKKSFQGNLPHPGMKQMFTPKLQIGKATFNYPFACLVNICDFQRYENI